MIAHRITLNRNELRKAVYVGGERRISAIENKRRDKGEAKPEKLWHIDMSGACGELAAAKHLRIFWDGNLGKLKAHDAGEAEVRTTHHAHGRLPLYPEDKQGFYILVTGYAPNFVVRGGIWLKEGKRQCWWGKLSPESRFSWNVPQKFLIDIPERFYFHNPNTQRSYPNAN